MRTSKEGKTTACEQITEYHSSIQSILDTVDQSQDDELYIVEMRPPDKVEEIGSQRQRR